MAEPSKTCFHLEPSCHSVHCHVMSLTSSSCHPLTDFTNLCFFQLVRLQTERMSINPRPGLGQDTVVFSITGPDKTVCYLSHTYIYYIFPGIKRTPSYSYDSRVRAPVSMASAAGEFPIPDLPFFFSIFLIIYLLAYFVVFRNWSPKIRPEASSCLISIFHGTPAVFLASRAVFFDPTRSFSSPNTASQNTVLDFSIAYFLTDLLHYVVFYPSDVLFIGHHLATLFVFLTCRFLVDHGACAILGLLILAEVTSACQNAWTLACAKRHEPNSRFAQKVYDLLSPPFYAFYSLVRGVFGPLYVWKMVAYYGEGGADGVIPKWVWISWVAVVGIAISVSILWIWNLWVEFFRERKAKSPQDKKNR